MFSGDQLAAARVAAGLTQTELAQIIGTHPSRISAWESSRQKPQPRLMGRLAIALDVPASKWLAQELGQPTLSDLRKSAGYTVDEVVAGTGITLRQYRGLETGKRVSDPPPDAVRALAVFLVLRQDVILAAIKASRKT